MALQDCTARIRAELQAFVDDGFVTPEQADEAAAYINRTADEAAEGRISEAQGLIKVMTLATAHRGAD